jgi:hypothetical protein
MQGNLLTANHLIPWSQDGLRSYRLNHRAFRTSASLLFPTLRQLKVKNWAANQHRRLRTTASLYRTVFQVFPVSVSLGTSGSALLQSPDMLHSLPESIQNSYGTLTQLLPVSQSSNHRGSKARQLSDTEWETLKPLLHTLYIEESRTLAATRKALLERHGLNLRYLSWFIPTK